MNGEFDTGRSRGTSRSLGLERLIRSHGDATRTVGLSIVDQVLSSAANAAVFVLLLRVLPAGLAREAAFALLVGNVVAGLSKAAFAESLTFATPEQRVAWIDGMTNSAAVGAGVFLLAWLSGSLIVQSPTAVYRLGFVAMVLAVAAVETMRGTFLVSRMPGRALRLDFIWSAGVVALVFAHRFDGLARAIVVSFGLVAFPCFALIAMRGRARSSSSVRLDLPTTLRFRLIAEYVIASLSSATAFALGAAVPGVSALVLRGVQVATGPVNSANLVATAVLPTIERDRQEKAVRSSRLRALSISILLTVSYLLVAGLIVCSFDVFGDGPITHALCRIWPAVMVLRVADVVSAQLFAPWRAAGAHNWNLAVRSVGAIGSLVTILLALFVGYGTGGFLWGMAFTRIIQVLLWSRRPRISS